jgi:Zn-dependent protease with chaperone function
MDSFLESITVRKIKSTQNGITLFYILLLFPLYALAVNYITRIDHIVFVLIMVLFVLILFRFLSPFYLGRRIGLEELPVSKAEHEHFKSITIIEGFAMADRIMAVPFKKSTYLDGLAIDMLFKRYIILNPRLFALGSRDYLRFVLFHELCHIKHHDSSGSFAIPMAIVLSCLIMSLIPGGIEFAENYLSYLDYIAAGIILIYLTTSLLRRRGIEKRADKYGIKSIGDEGVLRVYNQLGYKLVGKD